MPKDQGKKKGPGTNDATVKKDAAIPATPAALSDKELEKVAGGATIIVRPNTNIVFGSARAINTSTPK